MSTDPQEADLGADPTAPMVQLDATEKEDVGQEGLTIAEAEQKAKEQQGDPSAPQPQ